MANYVFCIFWALLSFRSLAEPLVVGKGIDGVALGKSLFFVEDPTLQLDLAGVRAIENWTQSSIKVPNFGFTHSAFWGRFTLRNPGTEGLPLIIEYSYASSDYLEFYGPGADGQFLKRVGGDHYPGSMLEIPYRLPTFRVYLAPGDTTFYLRLHTEGAAQLPINVYSPEPFHNKRMFESAFLAFLYGFLVVMVLYNSFLAISIRSLPHVIYVLFIMNSLFHFVGQQGHALLLLPDGLGIWLANKGFITTAGCEVMLACLFSRRFLELRFYSPKIDKAVLVAAGSGLAVMISTQFSYSVGSRLSIVSGLMATLSVLVGSCICVMKKFRPAYFFTLAWFVSIVGYICYILATAGVLPVTLLSSWGPFLGVSFEVVLISLALGDKMRLQQELAGNLIRDLNENLERKVEDKTRDIRSILTHIKLGILSIVGPDLVIDREYSASMESILNEKDLEGKPALELIFRDAHLPADVFATMESALRASLGEDEVAMDANRDCFINQVRLVQDGKDKILELDWNPIHTRGHITEKILVTVRDVTEIHEYQQAMQIHREELDHISELISVSPDQADRFFASARRFADESLRLVKEEKPSIGVVKVLFINMHTLKGSARSLGFKDLAANCHQMEQVLSVQQKNIATWNAQPILEQLQKLTDLIQTYEFINRNKLNRSSSLQSVTVAQDDLVETVQILDRLDQVNSWTDARPLLDSLRLRAFQHLYEKATDLVRELIQPLPRLARDLGKEPPHVVLDMTELMIDKAAGINIRNAMVHILRNAMDHGLEPTQERLSLGKPAEGEISIQLEDRGTHICLVICDDGRGLALQTIEQSAIQRGLIPQDHQLNHQQIGLLIFEPWFTTSQVITDLSGRGVGMDAVRSHVEQLGGRASLELEQESSGPLPAYAPFRLVLTIPERYVRRLYRTNSLQRSA